MKAAKTLFLLAITTGLSTFLSPAAFAQSSSDLHPWLEDSFILTVGGFYPRKEFKLSVDGESSNNQIDFDRDAAVVDSEATGALNFRWKFGEKWSLAGQYYATRDSGQAVLDEDIIFRDNVLRAGSNIGAGADLDLARIFLGREFFTDEPYHEFGLGFGLHWLQIGAYVEGEMFINDESRGFQRESVSADLPLPNIGGWYWRSLSPKWLLITRLDWFSASIGDYSGSLWNAGVGINYQAWEHVGFGLSYQYFKIDVDVEKNNWLGNVQLTQDGPALSVNFNW
ncbi:MAG TPA: hypothetical protein VFG52_11610 [Xanthomonadales bacterium]|nr:hypothetical protein [Xanthomonadales bacterium]